MKRVMMPLELTAENGAKAALICEFKFKPHEDAPEVVVPWDTIKEIYRAAVRLLGTTDAAPESTTINATPQGSTSPELVAAPQERWNEAAWSEFYDAHTWGPSPPLGRLDIDATREDLKGMWVALIDLCMTLPQAGAYLATRKELPPIIWEIFEQAKAAAELAALLRERHEYPDFPGPGEGLVSDEETWKAQEDWRNKFAAIDERIKAALKLTPPTDTQKWIATNPDFADALWCASFSGETPKACLSRLLRENDAYREALRAGFRVLAQHDSAEVQRWLKEPKVQ